MPYPQSFIDDLKRQADIVRVVGDYIQLKKKGSSWMACCPFHSEDTPSFSVSPAREIFYCFGCQKGGNVFTFIMEMEHISFPEAIKLAAKKAGVRLPAIDPRDEVQQSEKAQLLEVNKLALEWWELQLSSREGRSARSYLVERGIQDAVTTSFRLGYAPNSWEGLTQHLKQKIDVEVLEKSGIVVSKPEGGCYDRFRGRLMMPVFDAQGQPVAFNGRTLVGDQAKYMNSPETPVYTKGRHLFGLNITRQEIRRQGFAILVEGALDMLTPYQHGIKNVVASLGTSFTQVQADLLSRYTKQVVINYDGDTAGVLAAKKAIEHLSSKDMEIKVLVLPDSDPDEFIRTKGVKEYKRLRGQAKPHMQFVLDQACQNRDLNNPSSKASAIEDVLPYIRAIQNGVVKREYFDIAMNTLRVNDSAIRQELWWGVKNNGPNTQPVRVKLPPKIPTFAEKRLLEILLNDPAARAMLVPMLKEYDIEDWPTHNLFRAIIALAGVDLEPTFDRLSELLVDDQVVTSLLPQLMFAIPPENSLAEAYQCLDSLWLLSCDKLLASIRAEVSAAQSTEDLETRNELAEKYLTLVRKRNEIQRNQSRRSTQKVNA